MSANLIKSPAEAEEFMIRNQCLNSPSDFGEQELMKLLSESTVKKAAELVDFSLFFPPRCEKWAGREREAVLDRSKRWGSIPSPLEKRLK